MDQVQIFISYAREDQTRVETLYHRLVAAGFHPWLDREHILPGQRWEPIIKQALKRSDFALVCLSATSINKRGFLQKEIKQALEHALEKLEDDVWLIPVRLDDCDVPDSLSVIQWVDLFEDDGFDQLLRALEFQLSKDGRKPPSPQPKSQPQTPSKPRPPSPKAVPPPVVVEKPIVSTRNPKTFTVDLNGMKLEMIQLPGGEFTMGSNEFANEKPSHQVKISPFAIGKYQLTQAQWNALMPDNPSRFKGAGDLPVENVSWTMAQDFIKRLNDKIGNGTYRLPTEAEWEYAARAGSQGRYSFGDDESELRNYAWFFENSNSQTHPVGQLRPNAFGLYDMHGNVWEWCSDWYDESYYEECRKQGVVVDPQGPSTGSARVLRGGSWRNIAVLCRSAIRNYDTPGARIGSLGFRLVRVGP